MCLIFPMNTIFVRKWGWTGADTRVVFFRFDNAFINPKKEPTRWCQIQKKPVPKYNSLPSTPHTLTTETLVTKTQYIYEHFIKKYKKLWFSPMKYIYVDKLFFVDKYRIKMHGRMKFFMKLRIWFSKFAQIFGIIKICEY